MKRLRKLETDFLENICEKLIDSSYLNKDVYNNLGRRLTEAEAIEIREKSLNNFKELSHRKLEEMYSEEGLERKFLELKRLSDTAPKSIKGWRPAEDPAKDSYGARRPALIEHIRKLKEFRTKLEFQLYSDEEDKEGEEKDEAQMAN